MDFDFGGIINPIEQFFGTNKSGAKTDSDGIGINIFSIKQQSISLIIALSDIMPTTIAVSSETKEALRLLGQKGESYDHIIKRLIEKTAWKELDNRWNRILEEDEFISIDMAYSHYIRTPDHENVEKR